MRAGGKGGGGRSRKRWEGGGGTSGEKKTRNRLKQHSKLLPNKTGNLSRALREMPGAARRRYAVFQLISSERKNDAVIATAICSEHKSSARARSRTYYGVASIQTYIHCAAKWILPRFCVFFLLSFVFRGSPLVPCSNREAIIAIISLSTEGRGRREE